jgi:eukaryotic-like serine/threonine-protein kinase
VTSDEELLNRAKGRLGTVLKGKYRLDAVIGFGGMAIVYRATHTRNRAQLAVKMLHSELSVNADVRSRFLREGYAANTVNHPGAVLVVDDDVAEDGSAFLIMELLLGVTAEALLENEGRRVPVQAAVGIVHQLLDVLASAHAAGIVHRDVKPANLLVTRDGTVKVLDFGIARVLETAIGAGQVTGGGLPLGTPAYMAPEQAVARSVDIDAQTDVWAAGATLFALLSGELVHDGPTPAQILVYSATRPARSLSLVVPDVPKAVAAVVDRALQFEKKDRWPSAAAMRDALADACRETFGGPPTKDVLVPLVPRMPSMVPPSADDDLASAPTLNAGSLPPTGKSGSTSSPVSSARAPSRAPKPGQPRVALLAAALAALVLTLGVARVVRRSIDAPTYGDGSASAVSVRGGPILVAIVPFENRTADDMFAGTLECLLDSMLTRSATISSLAGVNMRAAALEVEPEGATIDAHLGPLIAARWRLPTVMVGGVVKRNRAGATIELTATDSATGGRIVTLTESAETLEAVPAAVGRLAVALRSALGDAPADVVDAMRSGLSGSLPALREFVLGKEQTHAGRYDEALAFGRRAVKTDATFVEARILVAVSLFNLDRRTEAEKSLNGIADSVEGLSEHRRLVVLSLYHGIREEFDQAARELAELVARWPLEGHNALNLAEIYLFSGDAHRALETMQAVAAKDKTWVVAQSNLVRMELVSSQFDIAATQAQRVFRDFPKPPPDLATWMALAEALQGHRDAALDAYRRVGQIDARAGVLAEADFAMFEGRFDDAEAMLRGRLATEATSHSEETFKAWAMLAELLWMKKDPTGAKDAAHYVLASTDPATLFRATHVLAQVGARDVAEEAAANLKTRLGLRARIFSALVSAAGQREAGRASEAVRTIEGSRTLGDFWLTLRALADAELEAGALEDANRDFELCLSRSGEGAMALVDTTPTLRYLPGVRYALARAREGLHRADAKEAYEAFLAMEPEAQHDPLVPDAKRRLSKLH